MRRTLWMSAVLVALTAVTPGATQLGQFGKMVDRAAQVHQDLTFSDQEEQQLGRDISAKLRDKYGVVQDAAVHKYVTLVGTVLAQESTRPGLPWTFIVLDTDGVNAFAAPGGFVHITRGALALLHDEAELADVLAHEISHVTLKHTINAITKSKAIDTAAKATRKDFLAQVTDRAYAAILENSYDRKDEIAADTTGVAVANAAGYTPTGLGDFLTRLADRNKNLKDPSGLFASHPDTTARLESLTKTITGQKLTATARVAARYAQHVSYKPAAVDALGGAAAEPAAAKASDSGGGKLGLAGGSAMGRDKSSNQTVSSAGSRGVNPDRDAKGGPVKTTVAVTVTNAEVMDFRKGITG
jgi:beta-barrel assembly-enhancing protease